MIKPKTLVMKKIILLFIILLVGGIKLIAQSLPIGTCGIVYTYDAAGNRTQREYVCNNGLVAGQSNQTTDAASANDIMKVDVLYPNPTTGFFTVKLFQPLNQATVTINDVSGRIILRKIETGSILSYDLSKQPSGEYHLTIHQGDHSISMKIIKSK